MSTPTSNALSRKPRQRRISPMLLIQRGQPWLRSYMFNSPRTQRAHQISVTPCGRIVPSRRDASSNAVSCYRAKPFTIKGVLNRSSQQGEITIAQSWPVAERTEASSSKTLAGPSWTVTGTLCSPSGMTTTHALAKSGDRAAAKLPGKFAEQTPAVPAERHVSVRLTRFAGASHHFSPPAMLRPRRLARDAGGDERAKAGHSG